MIRMKIPIAEQAEAADDLVRLVGFASEKIVSIETLGEDLVVSLEEGANEEDIGSKIKRILKHRSSSSPPAVICSIGETRRERFCTDFPEQLVKRYGNGLIGLKGEALRLFDYFNERFRAFALEAEAVENQYPTLLPISVLDKTGYLRTSPQYSMYVCHPKEDVDDLLLTSKAAGDKRIKEIIHEPEHVLSPAACFHCYMDLEKTELARPSVFTFLQKVFRHEGRMNWRGFGRLCDYHVREIVFIGDDRFVRKKRSECIEKVKQLAEELSIASRLCVTSDPFVVPTMQKFKQIQMEEESKLELQLAYGKEQFLATASFNLHGAAFTSPFQIQVKHIPHAVTGCIGFGLERWVLGFMAQHGTNPNDWKKIIPL
ncbi:hypothetical protein [Paenibacillus cymbidii]|uniref:hypothetical protein n=1 Tax=Paenibacillus cymbidii TaxID=1639034 RepID=UPI0010806B39|nr:hypothetical protein [Paenibacillus cymbidii]